MTPKGKEEQTLKMTPQRMAIMEYLEGNVAHPSAADIFNSVSQKFSTMSFATVYNTLQTLKGKGRLLELSLDPDKKRFDPNPEPHHHLICVRCKQIVDVHREFDLTLSEAEQSDFELIGNHVDFYGTCPECRQKGEERRESKSKKSKEQSMDYVCTVCGYRYETKFEKKEFESLPEDYHCPICNAPKSAFQATN